MVKFIQIFLLPLWVRTSLSSMPTLPDYPSLLRSSGWSHVMLPVPTRLLQTNIHSFLRNKPINVWLSFSCECSHLWLVQHIQWQLNERLIGPSKQKRKTPRKECLSVWSSRVGTVSVTWLRPEQLRRRLRLSRSLPFLRMSFLLSRLSHQISQIKQIKRIKCIFLTYFGQY